MGGMGGMIIVEDKETWPKELRELKQHAVVLQKWLWCTNATDPCGWNAAGHIMHTDHYWFPAIQHLEGPTTLPAVTSPADWTDVEYLSVNGVYQPTLEIGEGEHRYLRVLNTAVDIQLNVQLDKPCRMWVLGTDGTYIDGPRLVPNNKVILSTADRLDLIVQCPEAGQFELRNVLFSNEEVDYMGHPAYDEHSMPRAQSLFTFDVKRAENVKTKLPQSLPARPVWMHDLRTIPDEDVHIQRTVWMAGVPSVAGESSPYSYGVVNGIKLPGYWGDAVKPEFFLKQD
jgi:FtsP/CotA-like multicopper oxidase with cupredoxin domain